MVNLLKEIARRVTLLDILEESKQADKFFQTIADEDKRSWYSFKYLTRTACRVTTRLLVGDGVALAGIAASSMYSDNRWVTMGSATFVAAYLIDYILFDYLQPANLKHESR